MTKKELEQKVLALEVEISQLKSQLLTLSLQRSLMIVSAPVPAPVAPLLPPEYVTITCGPMNSHTAPTN